MEDFNYIKELNFSYKQDYYYNNIIIITNMVNNYNNYDIIHKYMDLYNLEYLFSYQLSLILIFQINFLLIFKVIIIIIFLFIFSQSPCLNFHFFFIFQIYQKHTKNMDTIIINQVYFNIIVKVYNISVLDNINYLRIMVHLLVQIRVFNLKELYNLNSKLYLIILLIFYQIDISQNQHQKTLS